MGLAFMVAPGSLTNNRQACILVDLNNQLINMAFDGSDNFIKNDEHSSHAEMNAILFASTIPAGVAYITYTPCYHCVKTLITCNINKIIYFPTKPLDSKITELVQNGHSWVEQFKGNLNWMRDYINTIDVFN